MPSEEKPERRSLVGMPPIVKKSTPQATPSTRPQRAAAAKSVPRSSTIVSSKKQSHAKQTAEESSDKEDEERAGSEDEESTEEHGDGETDDATPKKQASKRKRKRAYLTDYSTRKKKAASAKKPKPEPQPVEDEEEQEVEEEKGGSGDMEEEQQQGNPKEAGFMRYSPLQLMCDHLLRKIMAKDPEEYFAFPVTPSQAPDYYTIITQPMDFSKIRTKIEENAYDNLTELRADFDLIVQNAQTYNESNTVYHIAAARLASIVKYYFSENYLRYVFHSLPFANRVPLEKANLKPLAPIRVPYENKRRAAYVDNMTNEDCLKAADLKIRDKLTTREPPNGHLSFLANKEGKTVLNVIGDPQRQGLKLGDFVGRLDEGNPGLLTLSDNSGFRFANQAMPVSYLTHGPFSSFAPQYDSTWATLTKQDSDLLLRTYGDRVTVAEVCSLRNMVADAGEHFVQVIDDLLNFLTDGEHAKTQTALERKNETVVEIAKSSIPELLEDIETLENLGIDVSFVQDIRQRMHAERQRTVQTDLSHLGQAVADLAHLQQQRLGQQPPVTITKVAPPSAQEMKLAAQVQEGLTNQIRTQAAPGQLISDTAIHSAMGAPPDIDADILNEFFC